MTKARSITALDPKPTVKELHNKYFNLQDDIATLSRYATQLAERIDQYVYNEKNLSGTGLNMRVSALEAETRRVLQCLAEKFDELEAYCKKPHWLVRVFKWFIPL